MKLISEIKTKLLLSGNQSSMHLDIISQKHHSLNSIRRLSEAETWSNYNYETQSSPVLGAEGREMRKIKIYKTRRERKVKWWALF